MPNKTSTENLVEISDIRGNAVLLKNGSLRAVLEVSAINFELRSEAEQMGILQNFQNFLNSIDFPLQIMVSSRQLKMDEYLKSIDAAAESSQSELLKIQAQEYAKFINELLELSNIMSKNFYIILPFYIYETPTKTGILKSFGSIFSPSQVAKKINETEMDTYKAQLMQRVDLVLDGLLTLGLKAQLLEEEALKNLYYQLYNPGEPELQTQAGEAEQNTNG
ncbi:MAG TPA: hypothetical protein VFK07_02835 [Candidatus Paceibacterota bacterium]|nr:hypothetical protein [Candidatus Paceibacterota bacterium]